MNKSNNNITLDNLSVLLKILSLGIVVLLWIDWVYIILAPGDGPFQTINWISRVKDGQMPGKDFDVFHGIGLLWFHAILAIPFDSLRVLVYIHIVGSCVCQCMLWSWVFQIRGFSFKKSILLSFAMVSCLKFTEVLPIINCSIFVNAGHSLTGARVALALLSILLATELAGRHIRSIWMQTCVIGLGAAIAAWFSTDQVLAVLSASIIYTYFFHWNSQRSMCYNLLNSAFRAILCVCVTLSAYFLLLFLTTGGDAITPLKYWWSDLPATQFWYFGGEPNTYLKTYRDIFDPTMVSFGIIGLFFHIYGMRKRSAKTMAFHFMLFIYGLSSLVPLLGIYADHYLAGWVLTGLISATLAVLPAIKIFSTKIPLGLNILASVTIVVFSARIISNRQRHLYYVGNPGELSEIHLNQAAAYCPSSIPDYVWKEFHLEKPELSKNLLRAFYRLTPEVSLHQSRVGRYDYIIHALTEKQKQEYTENLLSCKPLFLRVPSQKNSMYTQWLWHQWPDLWISILRDYHFVGVHQGFSYLRRNEEAIAYHYSAVSISQVNSPNYCDLIVDEKINEVCLLKLSIRYRTKPRFGQSPLPFDKMTRVNLASSGVVDDQAFAWPAGSDYQTRQVLLLANGSSEVSIRISTEALFFPSGIEIADVRMEKLSGVHYPSLMEMLQK
jgi:hypothetical protein